MASITDDPEPYLSTVAEMLDAETMFDAADLLRKATPRIVETGYDNWNGGITSWTIYLAIDPQTFARIGAKRESLEDQISKRLQPTLVDQGNDEFTVRFVPKVETRPRSRTAFPKEISKATKKNIIDGLKIEKVHWAGALGDVEFLERLFDLEKLPSNDSRFEDAAGDIWQHRVNNDDWSDDWIYGDARFQLLTGSTDAFLRFLCEVVHPVVRTDRNDALRIVEHFNDQLRRDGWQLVEQEKIAGRPRFVAVRLNGGAPQPRSVSRARTVADALDAGWMQKEIERLENAIDRDPALAIGTAKELVETCCKSILNKRSVPFSKGADLPELTKQLAKELKLVPEGIPDAAKGSETIRLILRNLSALTQYLAELRGLYGSGHGRDGKHKGLAPRHARLAVAAAVAFIDFVTETYQQQEAHGADAN